MSTAISRQDAPQLIRYEAARTALAECVRIDEAAEWADKAAALKTYARQRDDKTLEDMATRIRARAVRRCFELLNELPADARGPGGKPGGGAHPQLASTASERAAAAKAAGMTPDEYKDTMRVGRVSPADFERLAESDTPPSIEELAKIGTRKQPKPLVDLQGVAPMDFSRSMHLSAAMERLVDLLNGTDAQTFARGVLPSERERVRGIAGTLQDFFNDLAKLPKEKHR